MQEVHLKVPLLQELSWLAAYDPDQKAFAVAVAHASIGLTGPSPHVGSLVHLQSKGGCLF